jgi:hypothetical protein
MYISFSAWRSRRMSSLCDTFSEACPMVAVGVLP